MKPKTKHTCPVLLLLVILGTFMIQAEQLSPNHIAKVKKQMEIWQVPGMAAGVIKNGRIVLLKGFGLRRIKGQLPVTPDTKFSLASISKAFSALSAAIIMDEIKKPINLPLKRLYPQLNLKDKKIEKQINLVDMFSHQTGLDGYDSLWYGGEYTGSQILQKIGEFDFNLPFRGQWKYNNVMYLLATEIVSTISSDSWDEVIKNKIFKPLGMLNSGCSVKEVLKTKNHAFSYKLNTGQLEEHGFPGPGQNLLYHPRASGSLFSSAGDMLKWIDFQLNNGRFKGKQIIPENLIKQSHKSRVKRPSSKNHSYPEIKSSAYALGWSIDSYRGKKRLHHAGTSMGFSGHISMIPEVDLGVIVLSNRICLLARAVNFYLTDLFLKKEPADWFGRFLKNE